MRKLLSATVITLSLGFAATSYGQEADVSVSQDTDASVPTWADGARAYRSEDYSTALSILRPLADQGGERLILTHDQTSFSNLLDREQSRLRTYESREGIGLYKH